jgi:hypothetical protein
MSQKRFAESVESTFGRHAAVPLNIVLDSLLLSFSIFRMLRTGQFGRKSLCNANSQVKPLLEVYVWS